MLDGRAHGIAVGQGLVALRLLAALTGVGLAADTVHGDGQGGVRLVGDGAEGHGPGGEALDDLAGGLHLLQGHGSRRFLEFEQTAQGEQALVLFVDHARELLVGAVVVGARGMLQLGDGVRRPHVGFTIHAKGVFTPHVQGVAVDERVAVGVAVPTHRFLRHFPETHPFDGGGGAGEVLVHEFAGEAHGVEDLGPAVGLIGGDAHLGHHLEQPLADGLDVTGAGLVQTDVGGQALVHLGDGLEGEIGIDGLGAVARQHREVVHLACRAGLHHQPGLGAQAGAHQMMVHGGGGQQGGNGDVMGVHSTVGEDEDVVALAHGLLGGRAEPLQGLLHAGGALLRGIADVQGAGAEGPAGVAVDLADALQVFIGENGLVHFQAHVTARLIQVQQVGARTDERHQGHHQFLADGIDGRIGDLGEVLLEIVEQGLGPIGEHRQGVVGPHGTHRLLAGDGHGRHEELEVLLGVTEGLLAVQQGVAVVGRALGTGPRRQVVEMDLGAIQPLLIGMGAGQLGLEFGVVDDAPGLHVDEKHLARLQAPLLDDLFLRNLEHAHLRGHHHQIVLGDEIARRTQAVTIQGGTDLAAVGEGHRRGTVPRFHQGGVVLVEGTALVVHEGVARPGLGNEQHHGMGQGIASRHQQLQSIVETGRVRLAFDDQRPEFLQVLAQELGGHGVAARRHPIDVAPQGVDLAVVGDHAEGLGQIPRGKGVGGETLVHQGHGGIRAFVHQVRIVDVHLVGQQHALVAQGATGQGRDVEGFAAFQVGGPHPVFHHLADHEQLALEGVLVRTLGTAAHEELAYHRFHGLDALPQAGVVGGHVTPAQQDLAFLLHHAFQKGLAGGAAALVAGQEDHAHAVFARRRQFDVLEGAFLAQEGVRNLQEDAGPVPGQGIGAHGATMGEVLQDAQALADDGMAALSFDVGDETDAAGIVLVARVVQALATRALEMDPSLLHVFRQRLT